MLLLLYTKNFSEMFRFYQKKMPRRDNGNPAGLPEDLLFYADFPVGTVTKRFIGGSATAAQVNVVFFGFFMA
jgi:hypothetical protein